MFNIEGSGYCIEGWGLGRAIEGDGIAIEGVGIAISKNTSNIQTRTGGFGVTISPFVT